MSFLSSLIDTITGRAAPSYIDVSPSMQAALQVRGQFDPERVMPWQSSRTANWGTIEGNERLIDTARKSVIVYACLTYLADAVAESPMKIYRTVKGEKTEQPDHRARQIIANPNPYMSESEFMALLVMCMGMQGYAVVEKVRSAGGIPVQLWPLRPDWLTKRLQPDGQSARDYTYRPPGIAERVIPADDLIVVPYRHDDRLVSPGVSPLQIAAREIGIDSSLTEFLKVFLDSGGIPPFALEYSDPISDQAIIDQMQEAWSQKYGGSQAYGKLPIFHGGYKIIKVGDGINDMAWPDLRSITEDKICQAFRVPRELVQTHSTAAGGSGLTTTEQEGAMLSLQRYGATPLRNRIDGAFTRAFLSEFTGGDPAYDLAFDVSDVLALQEDEDKRHARARANYESGGIMLDEYRQAMGMQPLPKGQGQFFAVSFSKLFIAPGGFLDATESSVYVRPPESIPATTSDGKSRRYRDETKLSKFALHLRATATQQNRKEQKRLSEILNRKLVKLFADQSERIAGSIAKSASGQSVKSLTDINWQAEEDALAEILNRFYMTAGETAAANASSLLSVEVAWDVSNPYINQVQELLGKRIKGIAETTRTDVARVVSDALTQGQTLDQIADQVRETIGGDAYKNRSMTISRTESMYSYGQASAASYAASGLVSEIELLDNSDHTDDYGASDGLTCAERNNLVVPLADAGKHLDAEHPNGSLSLLPVVVLGGD